MSDVIRSVPGMSIETTNTRDGLSGLVTAAWALWIAQLVFAAIAFAYMFLSLFSVASCSETSCDYATYSAIHTAFNAGLLVLLVGAAVGIVLLRRRPRIVIWIPVAGILLTVLLLLVTYPLSRDALGLALIGDRLYSDLVMSAG
jgi:hypothetical protein